MNIKSKKESKNEGAVCSKMKRAVWVKYPVYRARTLLGMFSSGIHYDDLIICNGQAVYKNGISKLQEQLNSLHGSENYHDKSIMLAENEILVYPNPTTTEVNFEYNFDKNEVADLVIYDIQGREQLRSKLYGYTSHARLSSLRLLQGVYIYKISKKDKTNFTGKLIIE